MPFIKLRKDLVINSDYVRMIKTLRDGNAALLFMDGEQEIIPPAALSWLLDMLEVSSALIVDTDTAPMHVTLTSKVAQLLRDEYPQGATVEQLTAVIPAGTVGYKGSLLNSDTVWSALQQLKTENVAIEVKFASADAPAVWMHASHAPKPWTCQHCFAHNPAHAASCEHCGKDKTLPVELDISEVIDRAASVNLRACAFCSGPIPYGIEWHTWRGGLPMHSDCALEFDKIGGRIEILATPSPNPLSNATPLAKDNQTALNPAPVKSYSGGRIEPIIYDALGTTPSPDPLSDAAPLAVSPGEDSAPITDQTTGD